MNKTQNAYAIAKAAHEAAAELYCDEVAALELTQERVTFAERQVLQQKYQLAELNAALQTAEMNMINWANAKVSKSKHYTSAHKSAIAEVMANISKPSVRKQMVDAAFRLA